MLNLKFGLLTVAIGLLAVSSAYAVPASGPGIVTGIEQTNFLLNVASGNEAYQCNPFGKANNCTARWNNKTKTAIAWASDKLT